MADSIVIPIDTTSVILAALLGGAITLGAVLLYMWVTGGIALPAPRPPPTVPPGLRVLRDEAGRIVEVTEIG